MAKTQTTKNPHAVAHDQDWVARRDAFGRSGAAGVHDDQRARRNGALRPNRNNTRSAKRRAHIADGW